MTREYVWGPGGSFVGAPVDELLVQVDGEGRAGWVMQDAGGDMVAVAVNATGSSGGEDVQRTAAPLALIFPAL